MRQVQTYQYAPDYAVSPGQILEETLQARNMKKQDLAQRCGLSAKTVSLIIGGQAPVSPQTALQLERVLGVSANIWNNLEANYRLSQAKQDSRQKLSQQVEWANRFPVKELVKRGFLTQHSDPVEMLEQLLGFFEVGSISAWQAKFSQLEVSFRRSPSFQSSLESVATWLRMGELLAERIHREPYNRSRFEQVLTEVRKLTVDGPETFEPKMTEMCGQAGIALVLVSELPGTHLSGAARWLAKDKALIMLSLRYKTDDHFWFSFFHESGHILHGSKKAIFLEETETWSSDEEDEADRFASNMLIPPVAYAEFVRCRRYGSADIVAFAKRHAIAPGVVVGRLQHDRYVDWSRLNRLKRRFALVETSD